jgi:hypothetical protein
MDDVQNCDSYMQKYRTILTITQRHKFVVLSSLIGERHHTKSGDQNEKPISDINYRTVYHGFKYPLKTNDS